MRGEYFMTKKNMINESKKPIKKQNADRHGVAQRIECDGFTAKKIGEESSYEGETETARRMRRGDESKGDPDERDVAGAVKPEDVSPDISADSKLSSGE